MMCYEKYMKNDFGMVVILTEYVYFLMSYLIWNFYGLLVHILKLLDEISKLNNLRIKIKKNKTNGLSTDNRIWNGVLSKLFKKYSQSFFFKCMVSRILMKDSLLVICYCIQICYKISCQIKIVLLWRRIRYFLFLKLLQEIL